MPLRWSAVISDAAARQSMPMFGAQQPQVIPGLKRAQSVSGRGVYSVPLILEIM